MTKRTGFWVARGKGALKNFAYMTVSPMGIKRDVVGDWVINEGIGAFPETYKCFLRWYGIPLKPGEGPVRIGTRRGKP